MKLYEITQGIREVKDMASDPDIDPQAITDTLESLDGDLTEKLLSIGVIYKEMSSDVDGISTEIDRLQASKKRLTTAQDKLKEYALNNMRLAEKTFVKDVRAIISIKKNPASVVIEDEAKFVEWAKINNINLLTFAPTPEPKPNKSEIKIILANAQIEGVRLEVKERIDIK